jgi:hydroxymethylpyrimidine/phosphomethylpyrimidine kinase
MESRGAKGTSQKREIRPASAVSGGTSGAPPCVALSKQWLFKKKGEKMKTALTIAGSDSSGGAGIQADLKTMTLNGVYAMSAVTALTAQNTTGVTDILEATPTFLAEELDAVFTDIFPDAVKIGMVSSSGLISVIAEKLRRYGAKHIVADPVMVATSGAKLLRSDAVGTLEEELLPLADLLTPNIPEAEILSGRTIASPGDMEEAAAAIGGRYHCAVLCKGGHRVNDANDLLWRDGAVRWFNGKRIGNPNTHGTGCTLSSAIAANLAKGFSLDDAVERAKAYLSGALEAKLDLGRGSGPMDHAFDLKPAYREEARA